MDIELVTDPYACMMYIVSPLVGLGGGILWRPPAYSLLVRKHLGVRFNAKLYVCCMPQSARDECLTPVSEAGIDPYVLFEYVLFVILWLNTSTTT